jgi:hypothetical protein
MAAITGQTSKLVYHTAKTHSSFNIGVSSYNTIGDLSVSCAVEFDLL